MLFVLVPILFWLMAIYFLFGQRTVLGKAGIALLLISTIYILGYAENIAVPELFSTFFWVRAQVFGWVLFHALWSLFILYYTGYQDWDTRPRIAISSLLHFLIFVLLMLNIRQFSGTGSLLNLQSISGWIFIVYSVAVQIWVFALFRRMNKSNPWSRIIWQKRALLIAPLLPTIGYGLDATNWSLLETISFVPLGFAGAGFIAAWMLFNSKRAENGLIPPEVIFDLVADSVFILDSHDRLVDFNSVARQLFGTSISENFGKPIQNILPAWNSITSIERAADDSTPAIDLILNGINYTFEIRISPPHGCTQML
jgi:PAS domain-containing protein